MSTALYLMTSAREAARLLGGDVTGQRILCPGPGHSHTDRSLSVWFKQDAPDGFVVHSFAGDDPLACKDYVRERLNLPMPDWGHRRPYSRPRRATPTVAPANDEGRLIESGRTIFEAARDLRSTPGAIYLRGRGLDVSEDLSHVLRFSTSLWLDGEPACGMVALMRDAIRDVPCGLHRTFLKPDGSPVLEYVAKCAKCQPHNCKGHKVRKMLGRAKGAAIKLDAHKDIVAGLHIGEGIETCLTARQLGFRPTWAVGAAGFIASFPVLDGIEAISVIEENDNASWRASSELRSRYEDAGCEALRIVVPGNVSDLNDLLKEAV